MLSDTQTASRRVSQLWFVAVSLFLFWKILLAAFFAQPVPANDAYFYDGPVVNWVLHGKYVNPSLTEMFPKAGQTLFTAYPPLYQFSLYPWMKVFGTSAQSSMLFHVFCLAVYAWLAFCLIRKMPLHGKEWIGALFLFGITFHDRPDSVAQILGAAMLLFTWMKLESNGPACPGLAAAIAVCSAAIFFVVPQWGAAYFALLVSIFLVAWLIDRRKIPFITIGSALGLVVAAIFAIKTLRPEWWSGFMEHASQTPTLTGFRIPIATDIIKAVRNLPAYFLGLALVPILWSAWRASCHESDRSATNVLILTFGLLAAGCAMIVASWCLVSPSVSNGLVYTQPFVAAGLIFLIARFKPAWQQITLVLISGCLALLSIRAVGLSTWGVRCSLDVPYAGALESVRAELNRSDLATTKLFMSSPFLYEAAAKHSDSARHLDWWPIGRKLQAGADPSSIRLDQRHLLIVSQFDYYRNFQPIIEGLRKAHPNDAISMRNLARFPVPDANPRFQRVLQHISWAPIIIEINPAGVK